jgi:GGDEF domain-containing protein
MSSTPPPVTSKYAAFVREHWADALMPLGVLALVGSALFVNELIMAAVGLALVVTQGVLLGYAAHSANEANAEAALWRERADVARRELLSFRQRAVHEDHQTGLGNMRQLELDWVKGIARFRRHAEPCCMVVFEIRHTLGREAVDFESVTGVAGVLMRVARAEDSVCRISEGRFAILLSGADALGGSRFIQRARVRANTELFQLGGNMTFLELLGGVAEWDDSYEDMAGLLHAAEMDLDAYAADYTRQAGEFQSKAN